VDCDNNNNKKHLEVLSLFYNGDDESITKTRVESLNKQTSNLDFKLTLEN
jgi:hypothetical protein